MKVSIIKLRDDAIVPKHETSQSAAVDLAAAIDTTIVIKPMERQLVPTGLAIALPIGYEAQLRARSGLALKHGICLANGIGTVDADYRGELKVLLINLGTEDFVVEHGMRIAQMVIAKHETVEFDLVENLDKTDRGEAGFGSTGV